MLTADQLRELANWLLTAMLVSAQQGFQSTVTKPPAMLSPPSCCPLRVTLLQPARLQRTAQLAAAQQGISATQQKNAQQSCVRCSSRADDAVSQQQLYSFQKPEGA
jgi:hypothetical protein